MDNIAIVGAKELNQKISKIERSLADISNSLSIIAKILNRQVPPRQRYEIPSPSMSGDTIDCLDIDEEDGYSAGAGLLSED